MFVSTANLHLGEAELAKVYKHYLTWVSKHKKGLPPCIRPDEINPINIDHIYWLATEAGYGKHSQMA